MTAKDDRLSHDTATHRALHIPEIIYHILENLTFGIVGFPPNQQQSARRDLFSAALVCRDWTELATDLLWKNDPPCEAFRLSSLRQQHYVSKVRTLGVPDDSDLAVLRENLQPKIRFKSLNTLTLKIKGKQQPEETWLCQLVTSSLQKLHISSLCPCAIWPLVSRHCSRLQELEIKTKLLTNTYSFCRALASLKHLKRLELRGPWMFLPANCLFSLTRLTTLENLQLHTLINMVSIEQVADLSEVAFQDMREAALKVTLNSVSCVSRLVAARGLAGILLKIRPFVGGLVRELDAAPFAGFYHCRNLRRLHIDLLKPELQPVSATCLDELLSYVPGLRQLLIGCVFSSDSGETIGAIGRQCRDLEMLCLHWSAFDFRGFTGDKAVLPKLQHLVVYDLGPISAPSRDDDRLVDDNAAIRPHLEGLLKAAPNLRRLQVVNDDTIDAKFEAFVMEQSRRS